MARRFSLLEKDRLPCYGLAAMEFVKTQFEGLDAVGLTTAKFRMIIVTGAGPRIAHFGKPRGRNLLFWDSEGKYGRGDWKMRGGHRVWCTRPGADEGEETYAADNAPCQVKMGRTSVTATAPVDPVTRLQRSLTIRVLDDASVAVECRVLNTSDMLWSGGLWALTCTVPTEASTYGIPLGDGTDWDVFTMVTARRWAGHTSRVNDPQISFTEDNLVIRPQGHEAKRFIQAPQGVIGLTDTDERITFTKRAPYERNGVYPNNTNIAFYVGPDNFMVELETMGPMQTVRPGESLIHAEVWKLEKPVNWEKKYQ